MFPPSLILQRFLSWSALAAVILAAGLAAAPAQAKIRAHHLTRATPALRGTGLTPRPVRRVVRMPSSPTDPDKDAALIIDGATGKVLYARNETLERHPASLTKMMTLYLLFEALKAGKVTMQTPLPVSAHAMAQKPTKLNLRKGETISVDTAIRAIVIRSANDVAVVIAEALGGTEGSFAEAMTAKARALGMKETNFHNASGLPDPLQITTATDLGVLARHLAYDFPQYFSYFSLTGFTYKGAWYPTHDNLIGRYDGADGIKTGYTGASGFNLVTSVVRGGNHVVGVVMGGRTALRRDLEMMHLLDDAFVQIAANPALVAQRTVPWQAMASTTPQPVTAGFSLSPQPQAPQAAPQQPHPSAPAGLLASITARTSPALGQSAAGMFEDEDAAERHVAADEDASIMAPVPRPSRFTAPVVADTSAPPAPAAARPVMGKPAQIPAVRPRPRPDYVNPTAVVVALAMPAKPVPHPVMRPQIPEGDAESAAAVPPTSTVRNWTIQIGAYADQALARAQLAAYADKAKDVLGQAARIVTPALGADGHTIYRARFGLFAETQARDVCSRLSQRGQTCFVAIASAR